MGIMVYSLLWGNAGLNETINLSIVEILEDLPSGAQAFNPN